eukprot:scaffold51_cov401-Prasinococcus_capsulatus_cf.AAC.3
MIARFPEKEFQVLLFHYETPNANEWREYPWFTKVLHVTAEKQTKWWFAKRFLHPAIVSTFEYIFVWDEVWPYMRCVCDARGARCEEGMAAVQDLGLEQFNPMSFISILRRNSLLIAQPALNNTDVHWSITRRMPGQAEMHVERSPDETREDCPKGVEDPPCREYVEIMAPVLAGHAWECVWAMIQNDLVHGWGLDIHWHQCARQLLWAHEPAGRPHRVLRVEYVSQ